MIKKMWSSAAAVAVCLWPIWVWWAAYAIIGPESDVARVLVVGLGLWFLGGMQIIFIIVLIVCLVFIWADK